MFVSNLNQIQQETLFALSKKLIAADGKIEERELALLNIIKSQCIAGISEANDSGAECLKSVYDTNASKVSLLLELIGLANADDEYGDEEKAFIKEISDALSIPQVLLDDLESWVKRQLILIKEAQIFMED
jgi:uncharacterized membrane protein YebE (DUF533 family)